MRELHLSIADLIIALTNASPELPMAIESGYGPFVVEGATAADVTVTCTAGIPPEMLVEAESIYSAGQDGAELWDISRFNGALRFKVYDPNEPQKLQHVAILNTDFDHWHIHTEPIEEAGERGICPLLYPMGPLIMYYLTVRFDAIMIHASCIDDNGKGRVFSGFSGVGKSTMAGIWNGAGCKVINDDRLIIRPSDTGFVVHNTPMFYEDEPKKTALAAIYLPHHAKANELKQLAGSEALSRLMAFCIQHGYDRSYLEGHMNFLAELVAQVPVSTLGFVPTDAVIPFVRSHDRP